MPYILRRQFLVLLSLGALWSDAVEAQRSGALDGTLPPNPSPVAPFADPDSTINIVGNVAFPQFTPGACLAAAKLANVEVAHNYVVSADTIPSWERLDTLPAVVHAVGTVCHAPLTVSAVPGRELFNLVELSGLLSDTGTANAALRRWLATPPSLADEGEDAVTIQANRLVAALSVDLDHSSGVRPAGPEAAVVAEAQWILRSLDALGSAAQRQQLIAWSEFINYTVAYADRLGHWDPSQIIHGAETLLARYDAAAPSEWQSGPNASYDMRNLLYLWVYARGFLDPHGVVAFNDSLKAASHTAAALELPFFEQTARRLSQAGTLVTPLAGTYWFNSHGAAVWPQPGHLSLLAVVTTDARWRDVLWKLKRLDTKYAAQGLTITLVLKTKGYWLKDGTQTGPLPPLQEAADDSAYFLGYLKLPFTVVVVTTPFGHNADGEIVQSAPVPFETAYSQDLMRPDDLMMLSDRTGHLVVKDPPDMDEAQLDAYIARALKP